ncbi:MAG: DUF418 domain-containing protein, partial [Luteimonas sp.]|nr:DUF418 domain-containing protein [Luteimonas sp.]
SQRLDLLDALRGFALAGVLIANLEAFSLFYFLPAHDAPVLATLAVDRWLEPLGQLLWSGKFISLFSIMFGIGFALQMQRIGASGGKRWYLRRLAILGLIGLLHAAFWWGDILRWYAVAGLLLLPLARMRPRNLAILGVLLAGVPNLPLAQWWPGGWTPASHDQAFAAALAAFSSSHVGTMLQGNATFEHWWRQAQWSLLLTIPGRMLIGVAIGYSGVRRDPRAHARFWKWMLLCLPAGLVMAMLLVLSDYDRLAWLGADAISRPLHALVHETMLVVALGYAALFVHLFQRPAWRRWLQHLAPVGRMALSNYLAHTVVGIALFYGIGLGIGPRYGMVAVVIAWLVLFGAQVAFSRWWLDRFRFGPAEWVWRSLTYGKRQPMRRQPDDGAASTLAARS